MLVYRCLGLYIATRRYVLSFSASRIGTDGRTQDADGRKLDDQFYYQIEQDRADRAIIWQDVVRSKRATTKRDDVQYYWKPVRALVKRW